MRAFIIAGGSSLKGFDFHRLDGEVSIGINFVFKYYEPTILVWSDIDIYPKHKKEIDALNCVKLTHKHNITPAYKDVLGYEISGVFNGENGVGKGLYHRYLTGLIALSLAIALGYKPIYLLGYDCCFGKEGGHFYGDDLVNKSGQKEETFLRGIKYFDVYNQYGYIYNCSPISRLTQFPKVSIDEVLRDKQVVDIPAEKERVRKLFYYG